MESEKKASQRDAWRYLGKGAKKTSVYIPKETNVKLEALRKKLSLRSMNEVVNFLIDKYLDLYLAETDKKPTVVVTETRRYA